LEILKTTKNHACWVRGGTFEMKALKYIFIVLIVLVIIAIDLPENIKIKFNY